MVPIATNYGYHGNQLIMNNNNFRSFSKKKRNMSMGKGCGKVRQLCPSRLYTVETMIATNDEYHSNQL